MKYLFIVFSLSLCLPNKTLAVQNSCKTVESSEQQILSTKLKGDQEKYRKPNFLERFAIKLAQKSIAKKLAKGDVASSFTPDETGKGNPNKRGLISLIFSLVGVLFLFIPGGLAAIGGLFAIAGLILGIIGLKRDDDKTLALIGTIVGALVVVLYLTVILG